ncbi:MAG: hypothetical protein NC241_04695 [Bacteroides sp.]|nr:hypothetical protein [Bacteroides sp.]MCM1456961.1 hypothetical protein [Lachnoclostridium sp.]
MNRIFIFLSFIITAIIAKPENYIESINIISEDYVNEIHDAQIIRKIHGGTVIIPIFDESCTEEIKAPFSYACKIVEEYMPPCLPLKVKVSCGRVNSSSKGAISKVLAQDKEHFGASAHYNHVQMSVIKGVILEELCHNSMVTYLAHTPSIGFLIDDPDIEIIYNMQKLDDFSYSLEPNPGEQYDFVSVAIRDLLIGLGLSSSYRYDPVLKELVDPSQEFTPFESFIDKMLGNSGNPTARLENATKGELTLNEHSIETLKLYAPSPWQSGVSLNYFIPQDDCSVSKILSFDFCKGMVTRSLSDNYSNFIFYNLLGWKPNYVTSTTTPNYGSAGSTEILMPYNGYLPLNNNTSYGISFSVSESVPYKMSRIADDNDFDSLYNYVKSFHPFLYRGNNNSTEGTSISILKKDGSWDLVYYIPLNITDMNMSDWEFNYDEDKYARTIEGYLKARITTKSIGYNGKINYKSTYFVVDYVPQTVNLSFKFIVPSSPISTLASSTNRDVRIYFSNTEGLKRIVLEKLRQGARLPSKIEITDIKKGYFDTTIDKTTKFTAVGYNDNGISRSIPITIDPITVEQTLSYKITDNHIYIESDAPSLNNYNYNISSIEKSIPLITGSTSHSIDITSLSKGLYILTIQNTNAKQNTFKFRK